MTSLIGSARTTDNLTMQARTSAAIRQTAPAKSPAGGAASALAAQALIDPGSLVPHFLARVAVNPDIAAGACIDCGHSDAADSDVLYIVDSQWDDVAATVFPDPETT